MRQRSDTAGQIAATFEDAGISGAKGRKDRPGLDAMLKAVARREVDMVMAWSVDRLGRSLVDLLATLQELHAKDVDLYLHQQGLDTSTPSGRAMFQMMGVFSEFERAMIQERVRAGLARAKEDGVTLGRPTLGDHGPGAGGKGAGDAGGWCWSSQDRQDAWRRRRHGAEAFGCIVAALPQRSVPGHALRASSMPKAIDGSKLYSVIWISRNQYRSMHDLPFTHGSVNSLHRRLQSNPQRWASIHADELTTARAPPISVRRISSGGKQCKRELLSAEPAGSTNHQPIWCIEWPSARLISLTRRRRIMI